MLVLAVAVAFLTVVMFGLLRLYAEMIRGLNRAGIFLDGGAASAGHSDGLDITEGPASPDTAGAYDLVGTSPGGGRTKVSVTGVDRLTLLAFLSSACRTCERFWEAFAEPGLRLPGAGTRLVIVGQDPEYEAQAVFAELVPAGVKAILSSAAWEDYSVPGSPYFALVDGGTDRVLGSGTAPSWEQMRSMLARALEADGDERSRPYGRVSTGEREQRADAALHAAGIGPDHPDTDPAGSTRRGEGDSDSRIGSEG